MGTPGSVLAVRTAAEKILVREAPEVRAKVFMLREAAAPAGVRVEGGKSERNLAGIVIAMHGPRGLVALPLNQPLERRWFREADEPVDELTILTATEGRASVPRGRRAGAVER